LPVRAKSSRENHVKGSGTIVPRKIQVNDRGAKAVARLSGSATTGMSTDEILALTRG
jgi:hypothetical protein